MDTNRHMLSGTLALLSLAVAAPALEAQGQAPDFLFGAPRGAVTIRGGYRTASTTSDVFDFFKETLTVSDSDFNSPVFGVDVAWAIHSRIDLVGGIEFSKSTSDSEYRDLEEDDGTPIFQRTELSRAPLTVSLKLYLAPKGKAVSRFAFVPNKVRPYLGGGGGLIRYRLAQMGDFVDFTDLSIFTGLFASSGWSSELHAFGGVDISLNPRIYLSVEGRYVWADAALSDDFVGFAPIDLSGFQTTVGIQIHF